MSLHGRIHGVSRQPTRADPAWRILKPEPLLLLLLLLWLVLEILPLPLSSPLPYRQENSTQRICAVTATKWHTLPPITNRCQIACEYGTDSR